MSAVRLHEGSFLARALAGFVWCETFAVFGIQCFWVLAKSSPLAVDNIWGGLFAVFPFLTMLCLALGALHGGFRQALIRIEGWLHWSAALVQLLLLVYAVLHNPFTVIVPLAAPMLVWSAGLSVVLSANLSTHLRVRSSGESLAPVSRPFGTIVLMLLWWGGTIWICSGMAWVVHFWSASIVLHALLAPRGVHNGLAACVLRSPRGFPAFLRVPAEALLWLAFVLLIQTWNIQANPIMGTFEAKAPLYVDFYREAQFFLGLLILLFAARTRITAVTHGLALALGVLAHVTGAPGLALACGYAFAALFRVTQRQGALGYVFTSAIMAAIWMLGLTGFAFAGLIADYRAAQGLLHVLSFGSLSISVIALAAWLLLGWLASRKTPQKGVLRASPRAIHPAWVIGLLLLLSVIPGVVLLQGVAWPPFVLSSPMRQAVGEPMGICHGRLSPADPARGVLDELGVQSLRVGFAWSRIQPEPGVWRDAPFDEEVNEAIRNGKHAAGVLDYDNDDIEQDPEGRKRKKYIAPADIPVFLEYVRHVVERYKDRVSAWEIWNEPDIARFWTGSMEEFYTLARRTAETIRKVDREHPIIGTPMTSPFGVVTPRAIEGIHASGALALADHPNGHLYLTDPRHYYNEYWKLISTARRFRHPGSLNISELGSPDGGYYPWRSEGDMLASHVIKAYTIGTNLGVTLMNWYCLRDDDFEEQQKHPGNSELFFGLLRADNTWKPSAHAYRRFSRFCTRCEIRNDLLHTNGGLAACQLRSSLYRREDGSSALVLWFESALRPWGRAHVRLDLGQPVQAPLIHDIASAYAKPLLEDAVEVSEKPVLITFTDPSGGPVLLDVSGSPADGCWLLALACLVAGSLLVCVRRHTNAGEETTHEAVRCGGL